MDINSLKRTFEADFGLARECLEKNQMLEAKGYLSSALESVLRIANHTEGDEKNFFKKKATLIARLIEKIDEKLKPPQKTLPEHSSIKRSLLDEALNALFVLEGLANIKNRVGNLVNSLEYRDERMRSHIAVPPISSTSLCNMMFAGDCDIQKITVAHIIAEIFFAFGVAKTPEVVKIHADELISCVMGETEKRMQAAIDQAVGRMVFLDQIHCFLKEERMDILQEVGCVIHRAIEDSDCASIIILSGSQEDVEFFQKHSFVANHFSDPFYFDK